LRCAAPGGTVDLVLKLLRQLETQLAAMSESSRAEVIRGIRSIIAGSFIVRAAGIKLSMGAVGKAVGQIMIWAASDTIEEVMGHIKELAKGVGPNVVALFDAV